MANIRDALLSGISFFPPTARPPSRGKEAPIVASFSASSPVAGTGVHSSIAFTWTTENVDYIRLHFTCKKGLTIVAQGNPCGSDSYNHNHSPNSSEEVVFGNNIMASPDRPSIPVTVTLEPFANGVANPKLSKSLTITVSPYNAFPQGVPTSNVNMSISLSGNANGEFIYSHGDVIRIRWSAPPTPCVNLYLVQDDNRGGEIYLYKVSEPCLRPGSGGTYSWTIPGEFSGAGFRILGNSLGQPHSLSPAFTIR
jgi:hypothetical protein